MVIAVPLRSPLADKLTQTDNKRERPLFSGLFCCFVLSGGNAVTTRKDRPYADQRELDGEEHQQGREKPDDAIKGFI